MRLQCLSKTPAEAKRLAQDWTLFAISITGLKTAITTTEVAQAAITLDSKLLLKKTSISDDVMAVRDTAFTDSLQTVSSNSKPIFKKKISKQKHGPLFAKPGVHMPAKLISKPKKNKALPVFRPR
jgi:hypothetical protein